MFRKAIVHTVIVVVAFAGVVLAGAAPVRAEDGFRVPDCAALETWSSVLPLAADVKERHDPGFVANHEAAITELLSDEVMIPVFGVVNGQWDPSRKKLLSDAINHCNQALLKSGKGEAAQKLTEARYYAGQIRTALRVKNYGK